MYHLSIKTISRSAGRSATAAAAYRSGEIIVDERTGVTHDYTRKQGVQHTEIVLPAGAPPWRDRAHLWNAAENAETRKNSTVAREFEVAIPKELTCEQGIALVREFTQALVDKHGFAADFAIHKDDPRKWDGTEKGFIGYHAHILTSTRRVTRDGFGEKVRELDAMKGSGVDLVKHWREQWAITANRALERAGNEQRIDHRSLAEQGCDREPTKHLGPAATEHARNGKRSELVERLQVESSERKTQEEQIAKQQQSVAQKLALVDQALAALFELQRRQKDAESVDPKTAPPSAAPTIRSETPKTLAMATEKDLKPQFAKMTIEQQRAAYDILRKRIEEQRNKRLRDILARAQMREARRCRLQQAVVKQEPPLQQGPFAKIRQKTHEDADAALRKIREQAERLVQQARQLRMKLKEALANSHQWAQQVLRAGRASAGEPSGVASRSRGAKGAGTGKKAAQFRPEFRSMMSWARYCSGTQLLAIFHSL
jgi:ATP-dependent exoDNAse (exonuclease V) alpha subunit